MTARSLHHVQLAMPAGEEAAAIAFYEGILGIPQVPKPEHLAVRGGCWFSIGELRLHLGVDDDFTPATKAHPALLVDDLNAVVSRLTAAGIEARTDLPLAGYGRVYVDDPFGNRVELLQELG